MNPNQATWIEVSRSPDRRTCRNHRLVLQSMGMPHGTLEVDGAFVVVAREDVAVRAREEILRYERENVGWPPRERSPAPISQGIHAAIVYAGVMALFYLFQHTRQYGIDWAELGRADAAAIRGGEWWRAATALSLHVDLPHVAGNMLFGAAFAVILAQSVGVGFAWWGFLLTGTIGNLLNAWFQQPTHLSMGASTAVFGILGMQAAFEWMRRRELAYKGWRRWAPVIMGAGLLAWLGTGGASMDDKKALEGALERVDVMAHVFGFAVGIGFGAVLGKWHGSLRMSPIKQAMLTIAAPLALAAAWFAALTLGR